MQKKVLVIAILVLGISVCQVKAIDITFTADSIINDMDTFDNVEVVNDITVDMIGGRVIYGVKTQDASTFNLKDGTVGWIHSFDSSTVNITGGSLLKALSAYPSSQVNIYDVDANDLFDIDVYDGSEVNVYGGNISTNVLSIYPDSSLQILGGNINIDQVAMCNGCEEGVFIHGYDFIYDFNTNVFTGVLLHGGKIKINTLHPDNYDLLSLNSSFVVPEPEVVNLIKVVLDKKKLLKAYEVTLEKEWRVYKSLKQRLESGDYGDWKKRDIIKSRQNIHSAIQHQEQSKKTLEKSIKKLQESLDTLGYDLY